MGECQSVLILFYLDLTFQRRPLCRVLFLLHECRVTADIPVVSPLPGVSARGKQCLLLFRLHDGGHVSSIIFPSILPEKNPARRQTA